MNIPSNASNIPADQSKTSSLSSEITIKGSPIPADVKIHRLGAAHFLSDRKNFVTLVINKFLPELGDKTTIKVRVEGEANPVYMKVDDLSKELGISSKQLLADIKGMSEEGIAEYLKMEAVAKEIDSLIGKNLIPRAQIRETITLLSNKGITTEHLYTLLNSNKFAQFSSEKIARTLMAIGKDLTSHGNDAFRQISMPPVPASNIFSYEIKGNNIFIWGDTSQGDKDKEKINLNTLTTEIEKKVPQATEAPPKRQPVHKKHRSQFRDAQEVLKEIEGNKKPLQIPFDRDNFKALASSLGFDWKNNKSKFSALSKRMSYATMSKLVNDINDADDKKIMLNTFISIGKELKTHNDLKRIYKKRVKENNQITSHAYAIGKKSVYIAISKSKGGKIGEGSFKQVTRAIKINNFAGQKFEKQIESFVRIKPNPEPMGIPKAKVTAYIFKMVNQNLKEEARIFKDYLKDNPYAIKPHSLQVMSSTGKVVLFQSAHSGDGKLLFQHAPLMHKLSALIGFGRGLALMHRNHLVHMDVKPANLAFIGDYNSLEKLVEGRVADPGLAVKEGKRIKGGSPGYLPHEALLSSDYDNYDSHCLANPAIDSFSYGMLILNSILDDVPRFGESGEDEIDEIDQYFKDKVEFFEKELGGRAKAAMVEVAQKLIKFHPKDRMSCEDASNELTRILSIYVG